MKRLMLILTVCVMLLSLSSASVQTLSSSPVGICIHLPQIEKNSSFQNITFIQYPNKSLDIINSNMVKDGYSYYYVYCNTNQTGIYIVNGCSDISCWAYTFEITPNGSSLNIEKSIMYLGLIALCFIFMVICIWQFNSSTDLGWKIAYLSIAMIIMLGLSWIIYVVTLNYLYHIEILVTFTYLLWNVLRILFVVYIFAVGIYLLSEYINTKELNKFVDMGYSKDEANKMVKKK